MCVCVCVCVCVFRATAHTWWIILRNTISSMAFCTSSPMLTNTPSATSRNRYRRFSFSVFPLGSFTLSTLVLSAGLLQRHQSAQDPIPWLHQRLWGSYANGVRAQSQNTLHRTVTHHKEAERGESAQIYPAAGEDHIVLVHRVVLLCVYVFGGGFVSFFFYVYQNIPNWLNTWTFC